MLKFQTTAFARYYR